MIFCHFLAKQIIFFWYKPALESLKRKPWFQVSISENQGILELIIKW